MAEIVGGKPVDIRDYPWQVALRSGSFQFCGGSIINESWILSAAHCVDGNSGNIQILAGTAKLSQASLGQIRSVEQIVVYPGYQDVDQGKDASLLKLDTPLDLSGDKVKAIPILTAADRTAGLTDEGVTSWVSGWGTLSAGGSSPDALQAVDVPIIGNAKADEMYDDVALTDDQLAAGVLSTGGKDSCQGDSGGPLIVKDADGNPKLAGIVSWGYGCADAKYPGMYGRVSSFEGWINDVLDGGAEPPEPEALSNGTAVSELGASQSTWTTYKIDVPAGATNLVIKISGGTGDGDLYTRFGAIPTTAKWDCRPYTGTNDETCTVAAPQAGTYYASIYAYKAFASVNLLATFTAPATE